MFTLEDLNPYIYGASNLSDYVVYISRITILNQKLGFFFIINLNNRVHYDAHQAPAGTSLSSGS